MGLAERLAGLDSRLAASAARHRVPGAVLAVAQDDDLLELATGVLNRATGVETTPDSVFQIGSITKTLTGTLVMQLVDEGRLELDAPAYRYLPELGLGDPEATLGITLRQLLTHTSGMDGDFFEDTGSGDDCVERYVLACRALPQLHAPGELFSYCNAGFVLLGRIVEKLRGQPFDAALREHLLLPLGASRTGTRPEQAILRRAAVGHFQPPAGGEPQPFPLWRLPPSNAPAGSTPFGCARDLVRFARAHLDGGRTQGGARILSEGAVAAMRERQVDTPLRDPHAWALPWMLFDWGAPLFGHDGATIGQMSFLRVLPSQGIAAVLLTNGGEARGLFRELFGEVFGELAGLAIPEAPSPAPTFSADLRGLAGRYERLSVRFDIEVDDGALRATGAGRRGLFRAIPAETTRLRPVDATTFAAERPGFFFAEVVRFLDFAGERPGYLHTGLRANPRRP
jgi:CubicO group peptidase (beta-lactamase class C family)